MPRFVLFNCFPILDLQALHLQSYDFLEDIEVYDIAVLSFFSGGISVILVLMSGIAVSSSPAVCGFSSFWLRVLRKIRSFLVLRYRSFGLSCLMQVNIWKTLDLTVNEYTISDGYFMMKLVGHPITWLFDRYTDQFGSHVFSRRLRLISGVYMLEIKKYTRRIQR